MDYFFPFFDIMYRMNRHQTTFQVETISLGSTVSGGGRTKIRHSPNTMKRQLLQAMDSTGSAVAHNDDDFEPAHHRRRYSSTDGAGGVAGMSPDFTDIFQPEQPSGPGRASLSGSSSRKSSSGSAKFPVRNRVSADVVVNLWSDYDFYLHIPGFCQNKTDLEKTRKNFWKNATIHAPIWMWRQYKMYRYLNSGLSFAWNWRNLKLFNIPYSINKSKISLVFSED